MKLGSLKEGGRDGTLIVVDRALRRAVRATGIAPTLPIRIWNQMRFGFTPSVNAISP
jgi:ABC-type spermidine/putrescine transport system permease subunit II